MKVNQIIRLRHFVVERLIAWVEACDVAPRDQSLHYEMAEALNSFVNLHPEYPLCSKGDMEYEARGDTGCKRR
jgi:hypothetical protein